MRENLDMGRPGDPRVQALLAALLRFDLLPAGFRNRPTTLGQNSISGVAGGPRGGPRPATAGRMGPMPNPTRTHREVTKGWHPDEQRWLERFRKTLAADYPETVKKALLFGSKARGDWTAESDIDVMVIVKDKAANSQERIAEMGEELVFSAECWSATPCVLTRTESEWAKGLSWGLAFHEAVEGEGVTLL